MLFWNKKKMDEKPAPSSSHHQNSSAAQMMAAMEETSNPENTKTALKAEVMQGAAIDICRFLNVSCSSFHADKCLETIEMLRKDESFRLSYFCITQFVFEKKFNEEDSGYFLTNVETLVSLAQNNYEQDKTNREKLQVYKMVLKIQDHINLAMQQQALVNKTHKEMIAETEKLLLPKINEITKDITTQLVSLVALFTALSFIVFGAISSLDGIMNALAESTKNTNSVLPPIIVTLVWAFFVMNLLFSFMYFVLRIIRKDGNMEMNKKCNVVQKYPVIFLANYILLACTTVCGFLWYAECNGLGRSFYEAATCDLNRNATFVIGLVIIIVSLSLIGYSLFGRYMENK